jgi:hypothetical protein
MRRLALAVALACVLSGVARAGEIPSTGAVAPPTPVTTPGEIHTTGGTEPGEIPTTGGTEAEDSSTVLTIILTFISIV